MNFLAHVHVAREAGDRDAAYLLGAALPDLASMAGVWLDRERMPERVAAGVRCHLRADEVFHGHPAFVAGSSALRAALLEAGLARGPARAVGHIGWELLLDGQLVRSAAEAAYWEAMAGAHRVRVAPAADGDVDVAGQRRWAEFVAVGGRRPELRYDDPVWVAERVVAVLGRRPRLRVPAAQVLVVAEVLAGQVEAVGSVAPQVFADVADALLGARPAQ